MVKFFLDDANHVVGIKTSGENKEELDDLLRSTPGQEFRSRYTFNGRDVPNVWVSPKYAIMDALRALRSVEVVIDPPFLSSRSGLEDQEFLGETLYFRRNIDESCVPRPFKGSYQREDTLRAIRQSRFSFTWEMGLGKTYAMIVTLNHLFKYGDIDSCFIITPGESLYNFHKELLEFNTFGLTADQVYVFDVVNRQPFSSGARVIMGTFRSFMSLCDDAYKAVTGRKVRTPQKPMLPFSTWGTNRALVIDEYHNLRSPGSRTSQLIMLHRQYFEYRYILSGSPAPNRIEQLYVPVKLLDNALVPGSYNEWLSSVCDLGNRFSEYAINGYYPDRVAEFIERCTPWFARRFKKDELDLPPLNNDPLYVKFTPQHKKLYELFISSELTVLQERDGIVVPRKVRDRFAYLMQALDDPLLLQGKIDQVKSPELYRLVDNWKLEHHSKWQPLKDFITDSVDDEGYKTIVWSGHPAILDRLAKAYEKYNPTVIHGQTPIPAGKTKDKHRFDLLEDFKRDPSKKILFASYLVLSSAVNINEAPRALFWDRSWDFLYSLQAMSRNHRIGQEVAVFITSLVIDNSLDMLLDMTLDGRDDVNAHLFKELALPKETWRRIFSGERIQAIA